MPQESFALVDPVRPGIIEAAGRGRLERVRRQLELDGQDAILLYDPVNIRYSTDTTNMQVWTLHNRFRYALVTASGPVVLWEFHNCDHLHDENKQVDEIRPAISWAFFGAGDRVPEKVNEWACDLYGVLKKHLGDKPKLAVDTLDHDGVDALRDLGVEISGGEPIMERARMIKTDDELAMMRWTMQVCEAGIDRMYRELRPGMTEQQLWAWLHFENIRHGGEWIETRLLVSGPRTNPWMQQASERVMEQGDLLCFDTDLIGPYGYCADVSRAWIVGQVPPTDYQRELYRYAHEQIEHNAALLRPGTSFRELSKRAWPIPERFYKNRYSFVLHGVGMGDEYPGIAHWGEDWDRSGNDGVLERNMVVSVESYIGEDGGGEGVKLEQQYLVTDQGANAFCNYPWNADWL
ncbi:MAG: aminopeptidase P family protein [Woeseiaceae bacterium]|nr:aminopeptidase P family protein [Woeseiaceae bacterium]